MKYYVGKEAEATADVLYAAVEKLGTKSGTMRRKPKTETAKTT
jgi:hypothetical protein